MDDEEQKQLNEKKLTFFKEQNKKVSIVLKNGWRYSGKLIEVRADFCLIDDWKLGEHCIFYAEIQNVEPAKEEHERSGYQP